jgi:hypothetical protein
MRAARHPSTQSMCEKWHGHPLDKLGAGSARVVHGRWHARRQQYPGSQGALGTHGQDAHATTRQPLTHALREPAGQGDDAPGCFGRALCRGIMGQRSKIGAPAASDRILAANAGGWPMIVVEQPPGWR